MNEQAEKKAEVIPIDKAQCASAKFKVNLVLDGFPVEVEYEGKASDLAALVAKLKAIGAQPPASVPLTASKATAPICPHHNKPMKPSRKPGSFFCPHRMENGEYCPEKA